MYTQAFKNQVHFAPTFRLISAKVYLVDAIKQKVIAYFYSAVRTNWKELLWMDIGVYGSQQIIAATP